MPGKLPDIINGNPRGFTVPRLPRLEGSRAGAFSVLLGLFLAALYHGTLLFAAGELIAPTRTLEKVQGPPGRVIILSEPPGLAVFLDDTNIGRTPVRTKKVKSGFHKVRIKDSEKLVYVESGKTLQIILFKGSLISIVREEKKESRKPRIEESVSTKPGEVLQPLKVKRPKDLTPWERFINGSSPHF